MMKAAFSILLGAILLTGCMPKPSDADLVKNMRVFTWFDPQANFSSYSSFYYAEDTLPYVYNGDTTFYVSKKGSKTFVDAVTNSVNDKLIAAGYSKVDYKSSPSLWAYVYINETYNVQQSYSYYPYGYGYGGYYGGYYPSVSVSDQADVIIELYDNNIGLVWHCEIGDWVSSPDQYDFTLKAIDQAFNQSKYIKK